MAKSRLDERTPELGPEPPVIVIPRWARHKGKKFAREFFERMLLWNWPEIVGKTIARQVKPMGIRKGTLHLYGPNPVMNHEVRMMESAIVDRLNQYAGQKMVERLYVGRKWEHPDIVGEEQIHRAMIREREKAAPSPEMGKEVARMNLTTTEVDRAAGIAARVKDPDLARVIQRTIQRNQQLQKVRQKQGWTPCKECGALCEPEDELCPVCETRQRERMHYAISRTLAEVPWLRYREILEYVPDATQLAVNDIRADMVRNLASKIDAREMEREGSSIQAKQLTMLYRCVPPDKLTENAVKRTLYRLRFSLHRPDGYEMPKRYDVIPWGKKQQKKA